MPSDALPDLLAELAAAAEADDPSTVRARLDEIEAEFERIEPAEGALLGRAVAAREGADLDPDDRQAVDDLAREASAIELSRAAVLTTGALYVTDPSQVDGAELRQQAADLADEEAALVEQADAVEPVLDDADVPATVEAVETTTPAEPIPKGSTVEVALGLRNVGDEPATDVSVTASSELSTRPDAVTADALGPGERLDAAFEVDAAAAGSFAVDLSFESADDAGSRTIDLEILSKRGFVDRARETLQDVLTSLDQLDLPKGIEQSIRSKLDNADAKLADAADFADAGRAKQADNQLNAASNQLGALLNQLDGLGDDDKGKGNSGTPDVEGLDTLAAATEALIETIASARATEL